MAAGFAAATTAVRRFARAVETQAEDLGRFSGSVAGAVAQTDIRRELAELRRARTIGPDLAQAERLRARFEESLTDINTQILRLLLELVQELRPFIDTAIDTLKGLGGLLEKVDGEDALTAVAAAARSIHPLLGTVVDILRWFRGREEDKDDEEVEDPFVDQFFELLRDERGVIGEPAFGPPFPRVEPGV